MTSIKMEIWRVWGRGQSIYVCLHI